MTNNFYPKILEETVMTLEVISRSYAKDPSYLDDASCPYPEKFRELFRSKASMAHAPIIDLFAEDDEIEVVDTQIQKVLSDLEGMAAQMKTAETNERLSYFRVKTSLIEKLINLRERSLNLRELNEFRNVLISLIDEICTKDQTTTFMKRLDGLLGTESK